ncbi:hypothetical protein CYFUS_004794 [Cystobacter fuscus]|uniref:Uncharacterized protein n=1 Tax=Cystobacter fuscus TaxID=43 RepID=A0A250J738_9BACT|nr:hypothetical protein CYFUS_004794 [Cystobacter fuscus]
MKSAAGKHCRRPGGLAWTMETRVEARGMTFRVGVCEMTSRVMGLGVLVATVVHAQAVAPPPAPAPSMPVPVPRYVPEGAGAPMVGQPGEQSAPIDRSPNTRVLPPTRELGLWAADEPKAVKKPVPASPPDIDELLAARPSPGAPELLSCRQRVLRASKSSGQEETRHNLPRTPRECVTARLLLHCANLELIEFIRQAMHTPRLGGVDPIPARRAEVDAVFYWQFGLCEPFRSLPQIELLYSDIAFALDKQFKGEK